MSTDTRTRILDAATRLFGSADSGGASLRAIAREADVNPALVHYHFGSRENLFEATILAALTPIQARRARLLDGLLDADRAAPDARHLARLFVEPLLPDTGADANRHAAQLRLLSRVFSEQRALVQDLTLKHFGDVMVQLGAYLGAALPDLPSPTKQRRLRFCVEVAVESLATFEAKAFDAELRVADSRDEIVSDLIDFLAAGLAAKPSR